MLPSFCDRPLVLGLQIDRTGQLTTLFGQADPRIVGNRNARVTRPWFRRILGKFHTLGFWDRPG